MATNTTYEQIEQEISQKIIECGSNIVIEQEVPGGNWRCRRSSLGVSIPTDMLQSIGKNLSTQNIDRILLSFRGKNNNDVQNIFNYLAESQPSVDILKLLDQKDILYRYSSSIVTVPLSKKINKILMVAGLGDAEGRPLSYSFPHVGIEGIVYRLNRETMADARVYNPNMSSLDELVQFVKAEKPDIITLSVMETTFPKSLEVMDALISAHPESAYFWGGPTMPSAPLQDIVESFPLEGVFVDEGQALIRLASSMDKGNNVNTVIKTFSPCQGLVTKANIKDLAAKPSRFRSNINSDLFRDIPYGTVDLTTGRQGYSLPSNNDRVPVPRGKLSRNPLYINEDMLGNGCHGRCIFCSLTLNTQKPKTAEEIFKHIQIEISKNKHDSIYFGAPNLFEDEEFLFELIKLLKNDPEIKSVPKRGTVRVDYKNPDIIRELKEAGFVALAFGIETFYQPSLFGIGKATTRELNFRALDDTISAGMYPIIFNILMSRKSTILSVIEDIEILLQYTEKGAALETVPYLSTFWGTPSTRLDDSQLAPTVFHYKWMNKSFKFQRHVKYDDPKLEIVRDEALKILNEKLKSEKWPKWARNSFTFYSLLLGQSMVESAHKIAPEKISKDKCSDLCRKIDNLVDVLLKEETSTL